MVSDKLSCGYGFWNFIVDFVERNLKTVNCITLLLNYITLSSNSKSKFAGTSTILLLKKHKKEIA